MDTNSIMARTLGGFAIKGAVIIGAIYAVMEIAAYVGGVFNKASAAMSGLPL